MKILTLRFALAAFLLVPIVASAELLVYSGTIKEVFAGESTGLRVNSKLFLIIDHDTGKVARLNYATVNGIKRYRAVQMTNTHIVQVTGANGKGYSVLSRIPTDCELINDSTNESVIAKGANAILTVTTNTTVAFPKTLTSGGDGLFYSDSSGEAVMVQGSLAVSFNKTETISSNTGGETLDIALARLVLKVESLGYAE